MLCRQNLRKEAAARLKQAREKAGYLSPEDFCQKNELALALYLAHENGKLPIKSLQAQHYCKLLRVSLPWLLLGD